MNEGQVPAGIDVFYEIASERLNEQMSRIDALDTKIAGTFSMTTALLPLFGALLSFADRKPPELAVWLYGAAVVLYVPLIAFSFLAYVGAKWSRRPRLDQLAQKAVEHDEPTIRRWVAESITRSIEQNEPPLTRKGQWVTAAIVVLGLESFLLAAASVVALV